MILIIDDDYFNREILTNIFSPEHIIVEAESGKDALEKIDLLRDDLSAIFLDVVMPEMDGIEVLKEFAKMGIPEKIPIFMITASSEHDVLKSAYSLGVMDVINKPVIPYVVLRRVDSVVELFNARQNLSNTVSEQRVELYEKAQKIYELSRGILESLATAIEFRDMESGEHVRRIHDITKCLLVNTSFGDSLSEDEIDNIALASVLHDVGKIAISDAILNKKGRLTPEEYEIMKTHTTQGAKLLENIPQLYDNGAYEYACDIARHHHERWDGRGYPDGLKGNEISIWSQVVSIADVYDALISKRVYKDAYSSDTAVKMICNGECGVFNPELLDAFVKLEPEIRKLYHAK